MYLSCSDGLESISRIRLTLSVSKATWIDGGVVAEKARGESLARRRSFYVPGSIAPVFDVLESLSS